MVFSSLFTFNQQDQHDSAEKVFNGNSEQVESKASKSRRKHRKKRKVSSNLSGASTPTESVAKLSTTNTWNDNYGSLKQRNSPPRNDNTKWKWKAPSAPALDLSARLKEHSKHKRLQEALDLYRDPSNDALRDGHHGCIMVDCCARCGAIQEGENIIQEMEKSGVRISVETKTALLKGYAHAGQLHKAMSLFESMCRSRGKRDLPNVRTFNTLLRGCLWTAATSNDQGVVAGGVVTSETAWNLFLELCQKRFGGAGKVDLSSYEYSVTLLCQALRCREAETRLDELKQTYGATYSTRIMDHNVLGSLAVCYLSLARMHFLLGRFEKARADIISGLQAVDDAFKCSSDSDRNLQQELEQGNTTRVLNGGKQPWRRNDNIEQGVGSRRFESNVLFRNHRLHEIKGELRVLNETCPGHRTYSPVQLVRFLFSRLHYISGGGSTDLSACEGSLESSTVKSRDASQVSLRLIRNLWAGFGLRTALERAGYEGLLPQNQMDLTLKDATKIQAFVSFRGGVVTNDGCLDFHRIFRLGEEKNGSGSPHRPLDIEVGSGFGEWIVHQAKTNPSRDYVAVELRADRVSQIFSKMMTLGTGLPLKNLCIVGSECGDFLRSYVMKGVVSTIFINHPEPPTQTFGTESAVLQNIMEGHTEPAHMLNRKTFVAAASCLEANQSGRLVIVTDNRWYARLICATIVSVNRDNPGLLQTMGSDFAVQSGVRVVETFRSPSNGMNQVVLFQGQPCEEIGHARPNGAGASYFDRLWKSGAGKHAEQSSRFIIVMHRTSPNAGISECNSIETTVASLELGNNKRKLKQSCKRATKKLKTR